jgi:hypothetical protein
VNAPTVAPVGDESLGVPSRQRTLSDPATALQTCSDTHVHHTAERRAGGSAGRAERRSRVRQETNRQQREQVDAEQGLKHTEGHAGELFLELSLFFRVSRSREAIRAFEEAPLLLFPRLEPGFDEIGDDAAGARLGRLRECSHPPSDARGKTDASANGLGCCCHTASMHHYAPQCTFILSCAERSSQRASDVRSDEERPTSNSLYTSISVMTTGTLFAAVAVCGIALDLASWLDSDAGLRQMAGSRRAPSQATSVSTDELFTTLAIKTAPDGEVPPIELVVDGTAQFAVYDRFRLVSLAAREALRMGQRLDPGAPPATLLAPRLVILAFARTPMGSDTARPQSIQLADRTGRAVKRLPTLAPAELAAVLPGVSIPPLTLAASFAESELRPGDHVTVVFNQVADLMFSRGPHSPTPGQSSAGVAFTPPAAIATPWPALPPGVRLARAHVDVHVSAVLDLTGHVRYARALDGPADLQATAVAAVSLWTYTPAMIYSAPVPIAMQVAVPFHS